MLTVSDIANMYDISYQQVHDLMDYGYLTISKVDRPNKQGIRYLFSEEDIKDMDIHSHLAEIKDLATRYSRSSNKKNNQFKRVLNAVHHYDDFLDDIQYLPEAKILQASFFLFHLNHYAKTYTSEAKELYQLKTSVLKKMYTENPNIITATYLHGPDRKKIWLCEDCKDAAWGMGLSYVSYIQNELYCPKCELQLIEKEYYSLIEFHLEIEKYRFCFHQPRSKVMKWMKDIDQLPHRLRYVGRCSDQMYLYGRSISRVEEKVFPLPMVRNELTRYLTDAPINYEA
ncbi:MAG: hypothetical protein U9N81_06805 [Bacillota bacterium]|nr:hypothetical protein [Bacillota bacterium]